MDTYLLILAIASLLNLVGFVWLVVVGFKRSIMWGILIFIFSPISAIAFAITNWFDAKNSFLLYFISSIAVVASLFLVVEEYGGVDRINKVSALVESGQIKENEALLYLDPDTVLPGEEDDSEETEAGIDLDGDGVIDTPEKVITGDEVSNDDKKTASSNSADKTNAEPNAANVVQPKDEPELEVIIEEKKAQNYPTPGTVTVDPLISPKKKAKSGSIRVKVSKANKYIGRYFIVTTKKGNEHRGILVKVTRSRIILERKIYGGTFKYKVLKKRIKRMDMFKKEYVEDLS